MGIINFCLLKKRTKNKMFDALIQPSDNITYEFILAPLVTVFAGNMLLGVIVQICGKKDNSWIDSWWSISFLLPNIAVLILRAVKGTDEYAITPRMWLITACVLVWSLRLSIYIFIRHKSEDWRYKQMREAWTAQGQCVYYAKAFGSIYFGQGLFFPDQQQRCSIRKYLVVR